MRFRRIPTLISCLALCLGLAALLPATALADDEPAPVRKRVKVRVSQPLPAAQPKPPAQPQAAGARSPMDTVMRWAMGEMGGGMAEATQGMDAVLKKWFEGGDDVPMAGLRDAFKADGWTPEKLKGWMLSHAMQNAPRLLQNFGGGRNHFTVAGPMAPGMHPGRQRSFTMGGHGSGHGPGHGPGHGARRGHGSAGCPLCGGQGMQGAAPFGGRRGGRFQGGGRWGRRGPGHGRGGMPGLGARRWGGNARALMLWNDGSGWRSQELPGGMGHGSGRGRGMGMGNSMGRGMQRGPGHGMGNGMGRGMQRGPGHGMGNGMGRGMQRGPGHGMGGGMGRGMRNGMGPGGQMSPWMRHFTWAGPSHGAREYRLPVEKRGLQRRRPEGGQAPGDMQAWIDLARRLEGPLGADGQMDMEALRKLLEHAGANKKAPPRVRVRVQRPKSDDANDLEEVIEEEIIIEGGGGR